MLSETPSKAVIPDATPAPRPPRSYGFLVEYLGLIAALLLLIVVFSIVGRNFFSRATFLTIANQIPSTALVAVGMTYVLIIAGIDLSVGSVMALAAVVVGVLMNPDREMGYGWPLIPAMVLALLAGLLCGLFNGLVSVRWRLPSFIVTLGMLEIARGTAFMVGGPDTHYVGARLHALAGVSVLGLSLPFILASAAVVAGQLVLSRTVFGRFMVAVGTNEEAARLSGVDPRPVKVAVFALAGLLAALGGVIDASRLESGCYNMGAGLELQAIAAAVIGGTSLMGGRGSVVRTFLGVLIIAVLGDGLANVGAGEQAKRIVTGCVIIAAGILDYYRMRLRRA